MTEVDRYLRLPEALAFTGSKRSTLLGWIKEGKFPQPYKLQPDGRAVAWRLSEVQAWMASRHRRGNGGELGDSAAVLKPGRDTASIFNLPSRRVRGGSSR